MSPLLWMSTCSELFRVSNAKVGLTDWMCWRHQKTLNWFRFDDFRVNFEHIWRSKLLFLIAFILVVYFYFEHAFSSHICSFFYLFPYTQSNLHAFSWSFVNRCLINTYTTHEFSKDLLQKLWPGFLIQSIYLGNFCENS